MPTFFFTQANLLDVQPAGKQFGPDATEPEKKYRVCSLHKFTSDAIAYAIVKGEVKVQEIAGGNTVNLVLKPENPAAIDGLKIKYFIYRGIKKTSLINGAIIAATGTNDLVTLIWAEHEKMKTATAGSANPVTGDPSQDILGMNLQSLPGTDLIDKLFVYDPNRVIPSIGAGQSMGMFDMTEGGLEIVMEGYFLDDTLASLRTIDHVIDAGTFANTYANKSIREKVANYIDPCAFYGYLPDGDIQVSGSAGISASPANQEFFEKVLYPKFNNKDVLYIDIRNESDISHVYYKDNYGYRVVDFEITSATVVPFSDYATSKWPVFSIHYPSSFGVYAGNITGLKFGFEKELYENKPLLYFPRTTFNLKDRTYFISETNITGGITSQEPTPLSYIKLVTLTIYLPYYNNTGGAVPQTIITNYIRLRYFKEIKASVTGSAGAVFPKKNFFDNLFTIKNLPAGVTVPANGILVYKTGISSYGKFEIKDNPADTSPRYISGIFESFVAFEQSRVTLFAMLAVKYDYWGEFIEPNTIPEGEKPGTSFFKYLESVNKTQTQLAKHEIKITATNKAPFLNYTQVFDKVASVAKPFIIAGISLTTTEFAQVTTAASTATLDAALHPVFLQLHNIQDLNDIDQVAYKKAVLNLRGITTVGAITNILPAPVNIEIYTTEALFFSKLAATGEALTVTPVTRINTGNNKIVIEPNLLAALSNLGAEKQNMFAELVKLPTFKTYRDKMHAASGIKKLIFRHEDTGPNALADTTPKPYQLTGGVAEPLEIVIRIKPNYLVEGSVTSIIKTILHEIIHATVDYEMVRICGRASSLTKPQLIKLKANRTNPNARIYAELYCNFGDTDDPPTGTAKENDNVCERSYSHNYMAAHVRADIENAAREYETNAAITRADIPVIIKDKFLPAGSDQVPMTITKDMVFKALSWAGIDRTRKFRELASVNAASKQLFQLYTIISARESNALNYQLPPLVNTSGYNQPVYLPVTTPTPIQAVCS